MNAMEQDKKLLPVRSATLERVISALVSLGHATVGDLCEHSGISRTTVGAILRAATASGTVQCLKSPDSREARFSLDRRVGFLLLDLSSPTYTMTLTDGSLKVRRAVTYCCDDSISREENLTIFLSNCLPVIRIRHAHIPSVCVLYADGERTSLLSAIPSAADREYTEAIIETVLRISVFASFTESEAIELSLKYADSSLSERTCYLSYGSSVSLYFLSREQGVISSRLESLVLRSGKRAICAPSEITHEDEIAEALAEISRFAVAAYSPDRMLIRSCRHGTSTDRIAYLLHAGALVCESVPEICAHTSELPLPATGALKECAARLLRSRIVASDDA